LLGLLLKCLLTMPESLLILPDVVRMPRLMTTMGLSSKAASDWAKKWSQSFGLGLSAHLRQILTALAVLRVGDLTEPVLLELAVADAAQAANLEGMLVKVRSVDLWMVSPPPPPLLHIV
jgi:hypothetical protein